MFSAEELGRLSALGFYESASFFDRSPIDGVELFQLEYDPKIPAFEHVLPQNLVIGKRAEAFMRHYLDEHNDYELIADHVQVIDDKSTLGEMDFFYRERSSGTTWHMEMACKWYIYDPEASEEHRWVGPNKKDYLSHKLKKLNEQQFALLHDSRSASTLASFDIDPAKTSQILSLQGGAFVPSGYSGEVGPIRQDAIIGTWCTLAAFLEREDHGHHHYVADKKEWLIDPMYNREWHTRSNILNELIRCLNEERSPMVWSLHPDGSVERTFVVWW